MVEALSVLLLSLVDHVLLLLTVAVLVVTGSPLLYAPFDAMAQELTSFLKNFTLGISSANDSRYTKLYEIWIGNLKSV